MHARLCADTQRGPVQLQWKTTEQVTTKTKHGETVTSHAESGAGVPHSLDDA